jgi:hypothetical protein
MRSIIEPGIEEECMFDKPFYGKKPIRSKARTSVSEFVCGGLENVAKQIAHHHGVSIIKHTQTGSRLTFHTSNGNIHITPSQDGFYARFVAGLKGTAHYYRLTPSTQDSVSGYMLSGSGSLYGTRAFTPYRNGYEQKRT